MNKEYYKRDAEMIEALGKALREAGGGRAVMEWSGGSFSAKVAIQSDGNSEETMYFEPKELEAYLS